MKLVYLPIGILSGLLAGTDREEGVRAAMGVIEDREPPEAKHREIEYPKLVAALLLEGAIFRLVRGLVDHGARQGFAQFTGVWPGEEAPEPE
jgi:uncharacterized protein DUF4235